LERVEGEYAVNNNIKELAEQSGLYIAYDNKEITEKEIEFFAELIVRECIEAARTVGGSAGVEVENIIRNHFGVES